MNECSNNFDAYNLRNVCRTCLQITESVYPMVSEEINMYRNFVTKIPYVDYGTQICGVCRWLFRKYIKFSLQCQKACEILSQEIKLEPTSPNLLQSITSNNLAITPIVHDYIGPYYDLDHLDDDDVNDKDELGACDDDDLPLLMFKTNSCDEPVRVKHKKKKGLKQITTNADIKQEVDIKGEFETDTRGKYKNGVKRKRTKTELKAGFTSRMVQETDEYIVIKLTRDQVLQEMDEKSKSDVYLRAPYKCEKCVKGFNFEDVLSTHMDKHSMKNGTYQCDMCSQFCPSAVSLRGHIKSHTTRYKCKVCGHVRLSRQHLLEHHAISHTSAAATYRCDTCPFTTNKRTVIQRHVKSHISTEQRACEQCGKMFKSIESLRVHAMRHDKSRRFQCEQCDKMFIYPSLLHKHVQAVHERKDYYCVECDVKFKTPESLRLHFKKAKRHRDSTSYKYPCVHCSERFFTSSSLSVHLCAAHGAPRRHACGACARAYGSRAALRAHTWRAHAHTHTHAHRAALAPTCTVCRNTFSRKSVLKIHMRTHTGARPHACACGAAFAQRASLRAHAHAKHHKKEEMLPSQAEDTQCTQNEP